ncbi:retinol-binding protein pinta-like isoform X2 [Photinus pyralis]|uniref:retinol-binding protein pinta-like isoform X2 n=1 Tax=Photinus pyralis TaxID=7054 RepID=UPI00126754C0|nr:retinol-binding protein pinta-like isoform X2 [Photinus pyralis]
MNMLRRRVSRAFRKKSCNVELECLKEWMENNPDLQCKIDDHWLLVFLSSCKYNVERTKAKIEMFYIVRYAMPEIFTHRDPRLPRVQQILNLGLFVPLVNPTAEANYDTVIVRMTFFDPEKIPIQLIMKVDLMIIDVLLTDAATQFKDIEFLIDLKDFSNNYHEQLSPNQLKRLLHYFEDSYPVKVRAVHFINPPPFAMPFLNLFTLFVSEKNRNKIRVYCENEEFDVTQIFPRDALPVELNGTNSSLEEMRAQWKAKVEDYRDWFLEGENQPTPDSTVEDQFYFAR